MESESIPRAELGLSLGLLVAGNLLWGSPSGIDTGIPPSRIIGAFLIFVFFAHAVFRWGNWLRARCFGSFGEADATVALGLGLAFAIASIGLLGAVGSVRFGSSGIGVCLLAAGPILHAARRTREGRPAESSGWRRLEGLAAAALVLAFVTDRLLLATLPHGTTDPHMYHLLAPRYWLQTGGLSFPGFQPLAIYAWYWEHLFLWGQWLLGGADGGGALEAQMFAQWSHVVFGYFGVLLALRSIARGLGLAPAVAWAAALAGASSPNAMLTVWLAKNDWGSMFFTLAAVCAVRNSRNSPNSPNRTTSDSTAVLGGLLAGFAAGTKLSAIAFAAPALVLFQCLPWPGRADIVPRIRALGLSGATALLALGPILIRNLLEVGNPFLVDPTSIFGFEILGPTQLRAHRSFAGAWVADPSVWASQLARVWEEQPIGALALVIPVLALRLPRFRPLLPFLALAALGLVPFVFRFYSDFFTRWMGLGLVIPPFLAACGVLLSARGIPVLRSPWIWLGAAFALHPGPFFGRSLSAFSETQFALQAVRHPRIVLGGEAKAWVRLNLPPEAPIVTTGDNLLYLVLHHNIRSSADEPDLDRQVFKVFDAHRVLWIYLRKGMRYALDTDHWNAYYWSHAARAIRRLAFEHPEAVVYEGTASRVVDLDVLAPYYFPSCFERGAWVPVGPERGS